EVFKMRYPAHHENEVQWTVAYNLISDVDVTSAESVMRLRTRSAGPTNDSGDFFLGRNRRRIDNLNIRDETITALGNGLDVLRVAGCILQDPSDLRNVLSQIVFFNEFVRPDHP